MVYVHIQPNRRCPLPAAAAQADLRHNVVKAVHTGKTQGEVAQLLGVTRRAVNKWILAARQGGLSTPKAVRKGRPTGGRLKPAQAAIIECRGHF
jgi:transposase